MQKRSTTADLPAFFAPSELFIPGNTTVRTDVYPLQIFDFTYLHFHDDLEIGYCVSGAGICAVDGIEFPFKTGDAQIILPYQKHLSKNIGDRESHWYWINVEPGTVLERCGWQIASVAETILHHEMSAFGIFSREEYPEINGAVEKLFRETSADGMHGNEMFGVIVFEILILLSRLSKDLPKMEIRRDTGLKKLLPALDAIKSGVAKGQVPMVRELAAVCCQSEANFRRIFQKEIGISPKEYISQCQIRKAQNLLINSEKSVLEISEECGFDNISGFNRRFLEKNGITPSQLRKNTGVRHRPMK